ISSGVVRVLATDGHHELGGADVDGRLLDMIMERLEDQLSPAELDEFAEDKGAALRAHHLVGSAQLSALTAARRGTIGRAVSPGQVAPVAPRAVGILIEDSSDSAGERSYVEHLVIANAQLPVA